MVTTTDRQPDLKEGALVGEHYLLECDVRDTVAGPARIVVIHRVDRRPMGFRELWEVFEGHYPGRWALQVFPPRDQLIDQAHKYHLYVLESEPVGLAL